MENTNALLMPEPEAIQLLERFGIGFPEHSVARSEDEAADMAKSIGYPVVLKVISPQVIHKSDAGGVKVNLSTSGEVRAAYQEILKSVKHNMPEAEIHGILVVKQAPKGEEIIIGVVEDDVFGKTLMFGMGGIFTEVFNDVTFRVCPVDIKTAKDMIKEIKGHPILCGARGSKKADLDALSELIANVSNLALKFDEICEVDLNPVRLYSKGLSVLDARIMAKIVKRE